MRGTIAESQRAGLFPSALGGEHLFLPPSPEQTVLPRLVAGCCDAGPRAALGPLGPQWAHEIVGIFAHSVRVPPPLPSGLRNASPRVGDTRTPGSGQAALERAEGFCLRRLQVGQASAARASSFFMVWCSIRSGAGNWTLLSLAGQSARYPRRRDSRQVSVHFLYWPFSHRTFVFTRAAPETDAEPVRSSPGHSLGRPEPHDGRQRLSPERSSAE